MRLEVISDQTYCCVYIDDDNGGTTTCDTFNTKEEAIARRAQLTHPIGHVFQVCDVLRDVNVKSTTTTTTPTIMTLNDALIHHTKSM
jgi:hypothetical protein